MVKQIMTHRMTRTAALVILGVAMAGGTALGAPAAVNPLTGVKGDATIIVIGAVLIASTLIASSLHGRREVAG